MVSSVKEIARRKMFELNSPLLRSLCYKYWKVRGTADAENLTKEFIEDILNSRKEDWEIVYKPEIRSSTVRRLTNGLLLMCWYSRFANWIGSGFVHPSFRYEIIKTRKKMKRKRFATGAVIVEEFFYDLLCRMAQNSDYIPIHTDQTLSGLDFILYNLSERKWKIGFQVKEYISCYGKPKARDLHPLQKGTRGVFLVKLGRKLKERFPRKKFFLFTPYIWANKKRGMKIFEELEEAWDCLIYFWYEDYETPFTVELHNLSQLRNL